MSYCEANGERVIRGTITRPRIGVWHADLVVDSQKPESFTGPVTITLADGALTFQGAAHRSGDTRDMIMVRCVGGADGFATALGPKAYRGVPLRLVLQDILSAAGETISSTADFNVLNTELPYWSRSSGSAGTCMRALLAAAGNPAWRVLPDGTLWVGQESWTPAQVTNDLIREEPHLGRVEIAADLPSVNPGDSFLGQHVSYIEHAIEPSRVRHYIGFERDGEGDRLKAAVAAVIKAQFPRLDFLASYRCTAVAQNSDLSLELVPDDPRIAPLSGIPVRWPAGITAKVAPGARVLLSFAGGDPTQPQAELWESATVTELDLGGSTDAVVKGTTYRTAEDTLLAVLVSSISAAASAAGVPSAGTAASTALTAFQSAAPAYLSTVVKTA